MVWTARALAALALLTGCATGRSGVQLERLSSEVYMLRAASTVWIHITEDPRDPYNASPANGLLILDEEESVLVDTGWKPAHTELILRFAEEELARPVRRAVLTHGHDDRVGGAEVLARAHVKSLALAATRARLLELAPALEVEAFEGERRLAVGGRQIEVLFPGAGHAPDNLVVWLPEEKILFGGCLVRSGAATDLGHRGAAILAEWPLSLLRLLERYQEAELVVPGHGPPSGLGLLRHTLGLLEQEMSIPTPN